MCTYLPPISPKGERTGDCQYPIHLNTPVWLPPLRLGGPSVKNQWQARRPDKVNYLLHHFVLSMLNCVLAPHLMVFTYICKRKPILNTWEFLWMQQITSPRQHRQISKTCCENSRDGNAAVQIIPFWILLRAEAWFSNCIWSSFSAAIAGDLLWCSC